MFYQSLPIQLLPGISQITDFHQQAGQQPDNLCGPYWAAILLKSRGFTVTSEQIAQRAGSVLPIGDPLTWLPPGAASRQNYSLPLPATDTLEDAGTSAQGLIEAVAEFSQNRRLLLPLQTHWTADRLLTLVQLCQNFPDWSAIPLCNLRTGRLWGSHLSIDAAIAYLNQQPMQPAPADWDVGHFLILAGIVAGQAGQDSPLLWIIDTYPSFGWQGYHFQSAAAVADALNRGDGHTGGVLLFIAAPDRDQVTQLIQQQGFRVEVWDNGSPVITA